MKLARFLAIQTLVLGVFAFFVWTFLALRNTWTLRLSLDALSALGFAVAVTALFLLLVALPLQKLIGRAASLPLRLVVGAISGPLGVWLGYLAFSSVPIDPYWYIIRAWTLHVVYGGVGLCFAWSWHRRLRPNNSFKPNPLRGSA